MIIFERTVMTRLSLPKVGDRLVMALFVPESSTANKRPSGVSVMLTATRFIKSPLSREITTSAWKIAISLKWLAKHAR